MYRDKRKKNSSTDQTVTFKTKTHENKENFVLKFEHQWKSLKEKQNEQNQNVKNVTSVLTIEKLSQTIKCQNKSILSNYRMEQTKTRTKKKE